jgi:hypothetical protein
MQVRVLAIAILLALSACSQSPTRTGVEEVERARDIAQQLEHRNADLDERGSD